ncbi:MAG: alpha-glucosidase, partial [Acidobacteriaceae bacterium]|nr:alpha-glucosidase [Acidobacteriaceae bacterium]
LLAVLSVPCLASAPTSGNHWYDHAVIYEIYPRSFQDTNGDGIGDLPGITARLDYLQQLGIDAIWITPFFPSPNADFGYDVSDYVNVAPEYGTLQDWDKLVSEARKRGIRVLVDFVVNHTSDQHPWFKESRSSRNNPKRDWYVWRSGGGPTQPPTHWTSIFGGYTWTWDRRTEQWYYHIFLPQQPDVNWTNPGLRKAMFNVVRFWLDHGASGFRLDATPYLFEDPAFPDDPHPPQAGSAAALKSYNSGRPENHEVLREMRKILDSYPGDPVLLGESSTATIEDLARVYGKNDDEIQLPMDFLFGNLTTLDAELLKKQVDAAHFQLGGGTPVFFFSSHDHSRQWSTFGDGIHNDQIAKLTAALTLAQPGAVLLYYGEEIGMGTMPASQLKQVPTGPKRPRADDRDGERTPMQWNSGKNASFSTGSPWLPVESGFQSYNVENEKKNPGSIYTWYAKLLKLRRENLAFRDGAYLPLESGNSNVFAFGRKAGDDIALIVLNTSPQEQKVNITGISGEWPQFRNILMASPTARAPLSQSFTIASYGVLITASK